jgi:hypothetical protein
LNDFLHIQLHYSYLPSIICWRNPPIGLFQVAIPKNNKLKTTLT